MCPPGPPPCSRPLSNISSKKESFDSATLLYQEALKKSGHDYQLNFNPTPSKRKQRSRNAIRYNPPYNANVDTNVGHKFLRTIDECFPKSHAFHIIFYRNTLKLGYSCMPNIGSVISLHNKALLSRANQNSPSATKTSNCRKKDACPLAGKCLTKSLVYQATVKREDNTQQETYIGLTENSFKHDILTT